MSSENVGIIICDWYKDKSTLFFWCMTASTLKNVVYLNSTVLSYKGVEWEWWLDKK